MSKIVVEQAFSNGLAFFWPEEVLERLDDSYTGNERGFMRCLDGKVHEFDYRTFCNAVQQHDIERPFLFEYGRRFDTLDDAVKYTDGMVKFHEYVACAESLLFTAVKPEERSTLEQRLEVLCGELRGNEFVKNNELITFVLPEVPELKTIYDQIYQ
jgi:hypothetical protein